MIVPRNKLVLIDSGISFVEGIGFSYQKSIIRQNLTETPISDILLFNLHKLYTQLDSIDLPCVSPSEKQSVKDRIMQLLSCKQVI